MGLRVLVVLVLGWIVFRSVDLGSLDNRIGEIDPVYAGLGIVVIFLMYFLGGMRWQSVIRALDGPRGLGKPLSFFWTGAAFGQVLPASVGGDALRVWLAWRSGFGVRLSINSVLIERALVFAVLVIMVLLVAPFWKDRIGPLIPVWVPVIVGLGAGLGFLLLVSADRFYRFLPRLGWLQNLVTISVDMRRCLSSPRLMLSVILNSVANYLIVVLSAWLFAKSVSMQAGFLDCLLLIPPVLLMSSLPISFAGWGVREGAMVVLFGALANDPTNALLVSILLGLGSIVTSLPGLVIWLATTPRGARVGRVSELRETPGVDGKRFEKC